MGERKKLGLDRILSLIKSGMNPAQISKKYEIPKQTLDYSLAKLKKQECIEKVGYGVWKYKKGFKEVPNLTIRQSDKHPPKRIGTSPKKKEIRGHAFIWKIEFMEAYNWEKAIKRYNKRKLTFKFMSHNKQYRTILNGRKIWLGVKGLTIYEPLDFFGKSSFETKGRAVFEMDLLIKELLRELKLKFKPYRFTTSREHYGIIKNALAKQYNDKKEKMAIRSEDGTVWMWIDDSLSLGELENKEPNINRQVQNFWNNHKKHKFGVDADFVLNGFDKTNTAINKTSKAIQKNAENLDYHAENMRTHIKAVKELGESVTALTKIILRIEERLN